MIRIVIKQKALKWPFPRKAILLPGSSSYKLLDMYVVLIHTSNVKLSVKGPRAVMVSLSCFLLNLKVVPAPLKFFGP